MRYLFGNLFTHYAPASLNRGENDGNEQLIQQILWHNEPHTTISPFSIRWKIRYEFQEKGQKLYAKWDDRQQTHITQDVKISHCLENKKPLGTFTCSCGMVYSRTASEKSQDENYRVGKVITYGEIWEKRLQELVEVKKLGLRATAKELKIDPHTIKRYVTKLRLNAPWLCNKIKNKQVEIENIDALREQNRHQWLTLQKDYPNETKTTLRNLSPAVYSWLYRNDKDWLNEHSPELQKPISTNNKVNWLERDKEIKTQVETAVTQLLNREVPDRITISKIGRMTGLKATLEKKLEKLPLTQAYLLEVVESVAVFQNRRINWAISEIHRRGEEVKTWKVMRLAGMKEEEFERVEKMVLSRKHNLI